MEILTTLSPAETYLISEVSDAKLSEMLKLTFADLVRKKVLVIKEEEHQSHENNPVRIISYVGIGENFEGYSMLLHEYPFLKPFEATTDIEYLFRNYVKMCYQNAGSLKSYIYGAFIDNGKLGENFRQNWFARLIGGLYLSGKGLETNSNVMLTLQKLEKELPVLIEQDREQALEILKKLGGNIYLLKTIDLQAIPQLAEEFADYRKHQHNGYDSGCSSCGGFVYFDDFSTSFDNSCSSDTGGWSSGCGGDSGCSSGCSGCGGCGGCS